MLFNVDGFVFSVLVFFLFLSPLENNSMKGIGKHIIWVILTLFASCQETKKVNSNSDKEAVEEVHTVFVSNYPLRFFAEQIAGETVKIIFPADGSGDPAFWKPSIDQISEMQQVDLIFLNGAGYENWLNNISLPNDKVVVTSEAFKEEIITFKEAVTHNHGPEGEHAHETEAFTVWLNLKLALVQAKTINESLIENFPEQKELYNQNFKKLETKLKELDNNLTTVLSGFEGELLFSHPVYQYLKSAYNLQGKSLHWEPNQTLDKTALHDLEHQLEHYPYKWIIWENKPIPESVSKLEEKGVKSIVFEPCSTSPVSGDFITVMDNNIKNLKVLNQ